MKELSRTIGIVLIGLFLVFSICGCKKKEVSKQDNQAEKVTDQSQKINRINQLAEKVADLSKDLFPREMLNREEGYFLGAICIGKDPNSPKIYAVIEGWKRDSKNLEITVYADLNPGLEKEVNKHLLAHNYEQADLSLAKADLGICFKDLDLDGLTTTEIFDRLWTNDKDGNFIWVDANDLSVGELKKVNEAYRSALETIEPVLKKLKGDQERSEEQRIQTLMENIIKLGLADYNNTTKTEGAKPAQPADINQE